ncbi:MAG TPA: PEGA domain-containing protein [Vicinamibacterales bacterium]|nr:PEGA domain-containing protein [Vicinamibacterales bacterium]
MTSKARVGRNIIVVASVLAVAQPASSQIVYPFPPYGPIYYDSSLHLQVTPREAEVYVDGYYAGIVDNFDGMWQRLRLEPGQHEIVIYREGYRSHSERIYLAIDRTFKIRTQLERLAPGEPAEPRPVPLAPQASAGAIQAPRPLPGGSPGDRPSDRGQLSLRVEPADADVTIDGQPQSTAGRETLVIDMSEGRHVIQVRKAGYIGYLTEIEIRGGETTSVSVTLRPQP